MENKSSGQNNEFKEKNNYKLDDIKGIGEGTLKKLYRSMIRSVKALIRTLMPLIIVLILIPYIQKFRSSHSNLFGNR